MKFFSKQAVHSFQLKLLKQETNRAEKGRKVFKEKLETDRSKFRENVKPELMRSLVSCIKREMRNHSKMVQNRLNGNLDKVSERQDRPLVHFNEVHFLADVDKLVRELREKNTEGEKVCEIEASAKW